MTAEEREALFVQYERGPQLLEAALREVPQGAMQWRPGPGKWSVHEVVCHCADSETNAAMRVRYLVGEEGPAIQGYDQDRWARRFDYHAFPLDVALAQVKAVRRWTTEFIRRLPAEAWERRGTHSEMPGQPYTADKWLEIYAEHLEVHERQVRRNLAAYHASGR
jgi:hypothetical protein